MVSMYSVQFSSDSAFTITVKSVSSVLFVKQIYGLSFMINMCVFVTFEKGSKIFDFGIKQTCIQE